MVLEVVPAGHQTGDGSVVVVARRGGDGRLVRGRRVQRRHPVVTRGDPGTGPGSGRTGRAGLGGHARDTHVVMFESGALRK